jgi:hypothetical protein
MLRVMFAIEISYLLPLVVGVGDARQQARSRILRFNAADPY